MSVELSNEQYEKLIKLSKHFKKADAGNSYFFDAYNVLVKIKNGPKNVYAYYYNAVKNKNSIYLIEELVELSPIPVVNYHGDKIVAR